MKKNQKGQAIFEFIVFLPFMLTIIGLILTISSSINGSINQQKLARGYFFSRIKGNSTIPRPSTVENPNSNWNQIFGMFFIGFVTRLEGSSPMASCYRIVGIKDSDAGDVCASAPAANSTFIKIVRPQTVFGVCGETYFRNNLGVIRSDFRSRRISCLID